MTVEAELAWAAGFFDGEGSTYFQLRKQQKGRQRQYGYLTLSLNQTDPETLERFRDAVGIGSVYGPYNQKKDKWSPFWRYTIHNKDVDAVLTLLWPFLGTVKREQALAAYEKQKPYRDRPPLKGGPYPRKRKLHAVAA